MICEFTVNHYIDCLNLARESGYKIKRVCDYREGEKVILLRHDVDFSLDYAVQMAKAEWSSGFQSSYYIYLHSESYSALSPRNMEKIRELRRLGHEVGLHFDSRYHVPSESFTFTRIFDNGFIKSYTQHNPSMTEKMEFRLAVNPNDLPLKYISDSGRNWRSGCMCNWIGKEDKLHILVHPIWWMTNTASRLSAVLSLKDSMEKDLNVCVSNIKHMLSDYDKELGK